jgi:RNA polymerase sigma factor (sigma-70 family)
MSSSEFSQYLTDIGRFPVLSRESQLRHCHNIYRWVSWEGGRDKAPKKVSSSGSRSLETMVRTNLRLVVSIAKKYQNKGVELQDLIQEGNIGLIRGLELFDPARGYQVSTYCYWWVRQGVTRAIHSYARTIRMPINSHEMLVKIRRHRADVMAETGNYPTISETALAIKVSPERVTNLLDSWSMTNVVSLDKPIHEGEVDIKDYIPNPNQTTMNDPSEYLLSKSGDLKLRAAILQLNDTEQHIIKSVFEDGRSQKHISEELDISRTRVGQVQHRAIKKLAKAMAS